MALIIDRTSRILLFLRTTLGKESGSCSVNELTKSSRALSIRGSVPYISKKTDMTVTDSGRKSVTGCPTIFDPTSTKTRTNAQENRHDRHEKRQTRRADQGPTAKKSCTKTLNFRNDSENCERVLVNVSKIHHDHSYCSYLRRQEQVIHEESTVSTSGSGGPPLDKPVTADEVKYLITELEECRKKAKILEENSYSFHHWEFEFFF